jgi:pimeloyl-ACP methyl ester carboxylesterase
MRELRQARFDPAALKCRTLWVFCSRDAVSPLEAARMLRLGPEDQSVVIDSGHYPRTEGEVAQLGRALSQFAWEVRAELEGR